jgi:hypothetical protein
MPNLSQLKCLIACPKKSNYYPTRSVAALSLKTSKAKTSESTLNIQTLYSKSYQYSGINYHSDLDTKRGEI